MSHTQGFAFDVGCQNGLLKIRMTPATCILKISPGSLAFKDGIDYKVAIWPDRF